MSDQQQRIWKSVDEYTEKKLLSEEHRLDWVLETNSAESLPDYDVSPMQAQFLHVLLKAVGATRVLEIGTLGAYSTIFLARALPEDGLVRTLELEPRHAEVARRNADRAGIGERVEIIVGPATDSLQQMVQDGEPRFDAVFIDADKENNPTYLAHALKLSHRGTVIVTDNVIRGGAVIDPASNDPSIRGTRELFDLASQTDNLTTSVIQTVGRKGYDGFAISVVQ